MGKTGSYVIFKFKSLRHWCFTTKVYSSLRWKRHIYVHFIIFFLLSWVFLVSWVAEEAWLISQLIPRLYHNQIPVCLQQMYQDPHSTILLIILSFTETAIISTIILPYNLIFVNCRLLGEKIRAKNSQKKNWIYCNSLTLLLWRSIIANFSLYSDSDSRPKDHREQ